MIEIRRALLSVSDKTKLLDLAKVLSEKGVELIASGGTAHVLQSSGFKVTPVEVWTGSPEAMEGRIKTIHPRIHGGLLARRNHPGDLNDMKNLGLEPIDLLVVNFYPFEKTLSAQKEEHEIIEQIDVGGPSMVRAAAKNAEFVVTLSSVEQYDEFIRLFSDNDGKIPTEFGKKCGAQAFKNLVAYDSVIASWLNRNEFYALPLTKIRELRYGENPHQSAGLYTRTGSESKGLVAAEKLSGKELSYNNLLDADGALKLLAEFDEPACVIIKHVTPCGVGVDNLTTKAIELALQTDRVSAFGGIVALNRELDKTSAEFLADIFLEIVLAPSFTAEAREVFAKKKMLRLIEFDWSDLKKANMAKEIRQVWGGFLMQDSDNGLPEFEELKTVTKRRPTSAELNAMKLAWKICKHVRSNAIVFADEKHSLGIGAGQMSRLDSAQLAVRKAETAGLSLSGSVCASDAFFPFRDGLDIAAKSGATAVIQPGGSVRDDEVIAAADEHNMAMIFTGRRHFKH